MAKKLPASAKKKSTPGSQSANSAATKKEKKVTKTAAVKVKKVAAKSAGTATIAASESTAQKNKPRRGVEAGGKPRKITRPGVFLKACPHLKKTRKLGVLVNDEGGDSRKPVDLSETQVFPFSAICKVRVKFPLSARTKVEIGTAWYVSPTVLLTAGHVLYNHELGGKPISVEIWSPLVRRWLAASNYVWTGEWQKFGENRPERDFGAIKTTAVAPRFFPIQSLADETLAKCGVTVCGYPFDYEPRPGGEPVLVYATSSGCTPHTHTIDYRVDTLPGESGSPLLTLVDGTSDEVIALGIHNYGSPTSRDKRWGDKNTATRITPAVKKEIEGWIRSL